MTVQQDGDAVAAAVQPSAANPAPASSSAMSQLSEEVSEVLRSTADLAGGVSLPPSGSTAAELLPQQADALHGWFQPEHFVDPAFHADSYVAELRRFVPLESLKAELDTHLAFLKKRLVEVINEDYNDFVSLSTKLVDVDGVVLRMKKPLGELRDKLEGVQKAVQGELDELNAGLQRRQEIAAARGILDLLQDTAHVASKVEKLLMEVEQQEGDLRSEAVLEARTRLLERVASEVSRLNFYCNKGKGYPFVDEMEPRVQRYRYQLHDYLKDALDVALHERKTSAIFHCFHAYSALQDSAAAEEAVRAAIVTPIVEKVVEAHTSAGGAVLRGAGGAELAPVLTALADEIRSGCGFLLEIALNPQSGLQAFHLLSNSVLKAVHEAIKEHLARAFSPGVPATFLANYRASLAFLENLEGYCRSPVSVDAFRSSDEYAAFMRRWNLAVYFSLRFQDIAGKLDSAISPADLALEEPASASGFSVSASAALWSSLERCLSDEVFVGAIADRFLQLILQLIGRYRYWLASGLHLRLQHIAAAPVDKPAQKSEDTLNLEWALKLSAEDLAVLRLDVCRLVQRLPQELCPALAKLLSGVEPVALAQAIQSVQRRSGEVAAVGGEIDDAITALIADKCVQVVKQLRGITATYRMTTKPMPTRPLHYVSGVLVALRQFLDTPQAVALSDEVRGSLATGCAERVSRSYAEMAIDLLETVRKTEDSLKRLKKGRASKPGATPGTPSDQASDQEKIAMQLFLDAQEYGRQLRTVGLRPEQLPEYQRLWAAVAPADRQAIEILEPEPAE